MAKKIDVKLKLVQGPFGPHAGKWVFKYKNKWHHYRWASKKEIYNARTTNMVLQQRITLE